MLMCVCVVVSIGLVMGSSSDQGTMDLHENIWCMNNEYGALDRVWALELDTIKHEVDTK